MKKLNIFRKVFNHPAYIRTTATIKAVVFRLIPVIILALFFAQIAVLIDQHNYQKAPATNFLQYTTFDVQNAHVGEDVYFKVCRQHVSNIKYDGVFGIYIITNPDSKSPQRVKVYSQNVAGVINTDCENKVIRAADFQHEAGTYEMTFCVDFHVKYGFEKETCKNSNLYRIYPQPTDLQGQITDLQRRLTAAQAQLQNAQNAADPSGPNQSLAAPGQDSQPTNNASNGDKQPTNGGKSGTGVQPPTCAVNFGGFGLACGSDGLLRL